MKNRTILLVMMLAALLVGLAEPVGAFHHPRLGRFMQRDAAQYNDSMSLYQYQRQQPHARLDPTGRVIILAHGVDGTEWYGKAKDEIKKKFPKEDIIEFKYELAEPHTKLIFQKNRIVIDSSHPMNAIKMFGPLPVPHKEPLTRVLETTMDLLHHTPLIERIGWGKYAFPKAFLPRGMQGIYPKVGTEISLYSGSLSPLVEFPAAARLTMLLWKRKLLCPNEKLRYLGYSSGTRMLNLAYKMGAPSVDYVVFAGSSVPRHDGTVGRHSKNVVNYFSKHDFITHAFPIDVGLHYTIVPPVIQWKPALHFGGAGTWGLPQAGNVKNKPEQEMFHGNWMSERMMKEYVADLGEGVENDAK